MGVTIIKFMLQYMYFKLDYFQHKIIGKKKQNNNILRKYKIGIRIGI